MARIKDRLIFETKKMDAVAQRKLQKEQSLRSQESIQNRQAEKTQRRKDHMQLLDDWKETAASQRGKGGMDDGAFLDRMDGKKGKKRQWADKKYGYGGKRGRFKQNTPESINDMSSYNPKGNFEGGMKRSASRPKNGAGANRKGKRARDAGRTKKS